MWLFDLLSDHPCGPIKCSSAQGYHIFVLLGENYHCDTWMFVPFAHYLVILKEAYLTFKSVRNLRKYNLQIKTLITYTEVGVMGTTCSVFWHLDMVRRLSCL